MDLSHFRVFGFVVLQQFFDASPIGAEIDRLLPSEAGTSVNTPGAGEIRFQYVPMMTAETPASLALLARTQPLAERLFDGPVLPTRAKGTRYWGDTPWHADSGLPLASIGILAYLEPLRAETGSLRVIPGSHRPEFGDGLRSLGVSGKPAAGMPSHAIATDPGDLIVFDERLFHASSGGGVRRQWRVDYVADPADADAEDQTRAYFRGLFRSDWDGGYDVDRHPSHGEGWRRSASAIASRLEALGVLEMAARQEAFMRSRRLAEINPRGSTR
ncbi:MAG: phytanoyl-CoA dioxygenase family protein [Bryobacteraceae bacterium]